MSEYYNYLRGKKVILVGPSPSALGKGYASFIDSFDVVVRLNRAMQSIDLTSAETGRRTDVLYNCLHPGNEGGGDLNVEDWYRRKIKWICSPYPRLDFTNRNIDAFLARNRNRISFSIFEKVLYDDLVSEISTRPNTGTLAILDLLNSELRSLNVVGMTFGLDGYHKQYENITVEQYKKRADSGNHKIQPQIEYIKKHVLGNDDRFLPDETLLKVLQKN